VLINIEVLKEKLETAFKSLVALSEDIASSLIRKNRGKGGYKFIFNIKHYGDKQFSSSCSADTDARGKFCFGSFGLCGDD
jgi:hypothetical protein